jgi:hypothetical protein
VQITLDEVDLSALTSALARRFGRHLLASYLPGKTVMRDAVVEHLGCSAYEAEELVETLELQGYVRFPHLEDQTHPLTLHAWVIGGEPR